jgi:hypothetical protein
MKSDPNHRFMHAQIKRIEIDKWFKGCDIKRDPGAEYVFEWIGNNADAFRRKWDESKCQSCLSWDACGHAVKPDCSDFNPA